MGNHRGELMRYFPFNTKRELDGARRISGKAVRAALHSGALTKQGCACGDVQAEAHHDDYSKPLEVRWFCRRCHRAWHRDNATSLYVLRPAPKVLSRVNRSFASVYAAEILIGEVTNAAEAAMNAEGITRSDVSRLIGSSRQMVSLWFAGGFRTIKSLCAFASVVGYDVEIRLVKKSKSDSKVA